MIALLDEYRTQLSDVCGYANQTVENYASCMGKFARYLKEQNNIPVTQAQGTHICQWIAHLKQEGFSYSRMEHHRSALKTFYTMLVKLDIMAKSPAQALPKLKKNGPSTVMPVSKAIVFKLLNSIDRSTWMENRNHLILSFLWALGLRVSELTRLVIGSFEPGHGPKIGLLRVKGKNKKQRALFVVDKLYDNLLAYLSHPKTLKFKKDPMFPVESGTAISTDRVQRKLRQYCKKAGITERITPHVLRHSFATEMYHARVPLHAIQAMMGHSNTAETAIYIKVDDSFKQEALNQLVINGRMSWE
ncbi:tyrosine-type recombinase/integrase [Desulfobacula toluolica]|uniref:XerD2: tyrosine recombinase, subunit D n=1 Tax=Desulfobacula toluolica (strain DSM 7467 / Tol2) TaxID=651182 RepID=K0NPH0_DESTT|nr:tyrosine-type recombinase/integrase [Desulfobacula toluolica]CCK80747.1 XerD: tyrosine recombinase, subunit D [Desulfobacula toluolica Tol2]CCK80756.1 XerD2: tyrosine recombinase, subunit D [Desulfobacula toluolica Tol2]